MTPTPLSRYLDTVTAPFPPDTARRIRRELEEHALAHADALREAGHPDPEGAALTALGSATEVQHALMQTHFTRAEEEALWANRAYRRAEPREPGGLVFDAVIGLALPFISLLVGWGFSWVAYGVYVAGILVLGMLEGAIPRRWPARSARTLLVLLRAGRGIFAMLGLYTIWLSESSAFGAAILGIALGAVIGLLTWLRPLWPYLPKALRGAR